MNGRDLMYAIAGADPAFIRESERFAEIGAEFKKDRRRTGRRLAAAVIAAAVCLAVFGLVRFAPRGFRLTAPPEVSTAETPGGTEPSGAEHAAQPSASETTAAEETSAPEQPSAAAETPASERPARPRPAEEPESREPDTEAPATEPPKTEPPSTEPPPATEQPTQTPPATEPPTDAPSAAEGPGPGAVFTSVNVSYAEAKAVFAHPIATCASPGFTGYRVGIVSKNGDIHADGAFCLSVTYAFTNGTVGLDDQDRWNSSSYSTWGEAYEYRGRTFYVQTPDVSRDYVHIGYWPTLDRGIGYQAHFDEDADVYEIMDLIISLEI